MNITKQSLESDLHALKGALKHAGYDPNQLIKDYEIINGKYSERKIKTRTKKEKLQPGAQKTLDTWAAKSDKSCGIMEDTG